MSAIAVKEKFQIYSHLSEEGLKAMAQNLPTTTELELITSETNPSREEVFQSKEKSSKHQVRIKSITQNSTQNVFLIKGDIAFKTEYNHKTITTWYGFAGYYSAATQHGCIETTKHTATNKT